MQRPRSSAPKQTPSERAAPAKRTEASKRTVSGRENIELASLGITGKAFLLLEAVTQNRAPIAISEIVRSTGMTKPTAHRVATLLIEAGFIERDQLGRGYVEGPRLIELAMNTLASSAARSFRSGILRGVSEELGETCNFGILNGSEVVYLERVEAKWPLGLRFEAGSRVPAHCTAIGKLLLGRLTPDHLAAVIETLPLTRYTERTITDPQRLTDNIAQIRKTQIGIDDQEFIHGVVCVSVPVICANGETIGGIAVSAPEARVSLDEALAFVPVMRRAAAQLGATYRLGDGGPGGKRSGET